MNKNSIEKDGRNNTTGVHFIDTATEIVLDIFLPHWLDNENRSLLNRRGEIVGMQSWVES